MMILKWGLVESIWKIVANRILVVNRNNETNVQSLIVEGSRCSRQNKSKLMMKNTTDI